MTKFKNTDEELIIKLKEFAFTLGRTPKVGETTPTNGMPSGATYIKRFMTWGNALKRAGLKSNHTKWNIELLIDLFNDNNCKLISTEYINTDKPLDYECECGNISKIRIHDLIKGNRCKKCSMKKGTEKRTFTLDYVRSIYTECGCELLSDEYFGVETKLEFKCFCGYVSKKTLSEFQKVKQCTKCSRESGAKKRLLKFDDVKNFFMENNCILLSEDYVGNNKKLKYICLCGNHHEKDFDSFKKAPWCPKCGYEKMETRRLSYEYVTSVFKDGGCVLLSTEYYGSNVKMDYLCVCGNPSTISYSSFSSGVRCIQCGIDKNADRSRLSYEFVRQIFEDNHCKLLTEKYINNTQLLEFTCVCGNTGIRCLTDFKNGIRCQSCTRNRRSAFQKGVPRPERRGENHPQWDFSKSFEEREKGRSFTEYKICRTEVYKRDKYTCQCCGDKKGGNLVAHHIDGWDWCKDRRFDIDNIITLCDLCHDDFHHFYGFGGNTREQWEEYLSELYAEII